MTPLLTSDEIREHIDTDLGDDALDRLINDADAEIVARFGDHSGARTEVFHAANDCYLFLARTPLADAITSIVETYPGPAGETTVTLAVDDYEFLAPNRVRRLQNGTNSRQYWAPIVQVTYPVSPEDERRVRVTLDLVRLACMYEAASATKIGDRSTNHLDYNAEREKILRILEPPIFGVFA